MTSDPLQKQIDAAEQSFRSAQKWERRFWIVNVAWLALVILAIIALGRSASEYSRANQEWESISQGLNEVRGRLGTTSEEVARAKEEIQGLKSQLGAGVGASYRTELGKTQELQFDEPNIINYSQKLYDTDNAVTPGKSWQFKAPKAGIYSVSAYAAFSDDVGEMTVTLFKNGSVYVYMALAKPFRAGSMVGGTSEVPLELGDLIDIRVTPRGTTKPLRTVTAGTDWIRIRYVQALPKP